MTEVKTPEETIWLGVWLERASNSPDEIRKTAPPQ
jgi:hypothetical protein